MHYREQLRKRVRAGIRFLDDRSAAHSIYIPADWRGEIDWENLDMSYFGSDVLEQILSRRNLDGRKIGLSGTDVISLGFDLPSLEGSRYELLTEVWKEEVGA
ncbi:hypothetical protein [Herbidospora cretacea]|uniref:hypothetical protein n=1 Tax=Herbidospora cretacea TaxID=28444 RepID=UPI000B2D32CB|nr:hypothetical protein [Herbidospora cretacea]